MEVVDAHVHLWSLAARPQPWIDPIAMASIARDFTPADLAVAGAAADVREMVLVQVLNRRDETEDYLLEAAGNDLIRAVVGWVDLEADDVGEQLDQLAARPGGDLLAGIRHQAQAETDPGEWLARPHVRRGFDTVARRGLVCELMLRPAQLELAADLVRALPDATFVLNHAGKPPVVSGWGSSESADWARLVGAIAKADNVICKLSGLTTMADLATWRVTDLRPFVDTLVDAFGPRRLMFGSDWPVSLRAGDYRRTVDTAKELLASLSPADAEQVLAGNARRLYNVVTP